MAVMSIRDHEHWLEGYQGAVVRILKAGTTTLADVYLDEALTTPADNPQTLMKRTDGLNRQFGKWAQPLYTDQAVQVESLPNELSGIQRPALVALTDEDASDATVAATGTTGDRTLADRAAEVINLLDYGSIDTAVAATATMAAAIGEAASRGGGVVQLPEGSITLNTIALPGKVTVRGHGIGVTTIVSEVGGNVITLGGDQAGLADLTLDGIDLATGSVGIFGKARNRFMMMNVEVKRFEIGVYAQGGQDWLWRNVTVDNCVNNLRLYGDIDQGDPVPGDEFSGLDWLQGYVRYSTGIALDMGVVDRPVRHNTIAQVDFIDNIGTQAVRLHAASNTVFRQCYWDGNIVNIETEDDPDETLEYRIVSDIIIDGGQMYQGKSVFTETSQNVILRNVELDDCTIELDPSLVNQILLIDCSEYLMTATLDTTKLSRWRTIEQGLVQGFTTSATPAIVYKRKLAPNEVVHFDIRATAEQINGGDFAAFHVSHAARCAPATLAYDDQTANFAVGETITGETSGATAVITADSDSGTSGTLSLASVVGEFEDNELITDGATGSARVNGTLSLGVVSLAGSASDVFSHATAGASAWAVALVVSAQEAQVQLTGAASDTINWSVRVQETAL